MNSPLIRMEMIGNELWFFFKLENGEILTCKGLKECKKIMKKIDRGEIKIKSMEEINE